MTRKQAASVEKLFIQAFDSIDNGYNVAIGGDAPRATYLDAYVLDMIRAARKYFGEGTIADVAFSERNDQEAAEFWNEASQAVTRKHKRFSPTDEVHVDEYWYHMAQYEELWRKVEAGEDVTGWEEKSYEEARYDFLFGK